MRSWPLPKWTVLDPSQPSFSPDLGFQRDIEILRVCEFFPPYPINQLFPAILCVSRICLRETFFVWCGKCLLRTYQWTGITLRITLGSEPEKPAYPLKPPPVPSAIQQGIAKNDPLLQRQSLNLNQVYTRIIFIQISLRHELPKKGNARTRYYYVREVILGAASDLVPPLQFLDNVNTSLISSV